GPVLHPVGEADQGLDLLVVADPVDDHPQGGLIQDHVFQLGAILTHGLPDAVPQPVMAAAHHHVAVFAGVHRIDVDGQVPVAVAGLGGAVHAIPAPGIVVDEIGRASCR